MNGYAASQLYYEKLKDQGRDFKFIPGCEFYVHPDLDDWARYRAQEEQNKEERKKAERAARKRGDAPDNDVDNANALTVENEEASKTNKYRDPLKRRHHLVVLPKNTAGLKKIFSLVSYGYLDGFYRFPRIDIKRIKAVADDDIILSSACIGGPLAYEIFGVFADAQWDEMGPHLLNDSSNYEKVMRALGNAHDMYADSVGVHNMFLELQFNKMPQQDLVNLALLRYAVANGIQDQLIVTCDAHYPGPDLWRQRIMYKKLGYLNYTEIDPSAIPKSKDELECELYPKNAQQLWEEYVGCKARSSEYEAIEGIDEIVCAAVERTYDIAHTVIDELPPDREAKFPHISAEGDKPFNYLVQMCKKGLKKRGHAHKLEYVDRLKEELGVMKELGVSRYFNTLAVVMQLARTKVLTGPCRGSGGGSLVNYCLYITDVDPIKYDLYFSRFMSVYRKGMPDVDIDIDDRDTVLDLLRSEFGYTNVVPISNYNLLKLKSLTKDVCKFFGVPFEEVNAAMRTVEDDVRKSTLKEGDDKNLFQLTFDEAMEHSPSYREFIEKLAEDFPEAVESIQALYKEQRSLGRHAGGVLVVDDLRDKMPLITSGGEPQSPWVEGMAVKHLEKIGNFIKYDLLGLLTLRLIRRTIELVLEKQVRIDIDGQTLFLAPEEKVELTAGMFKKAKDIIEGDEIDDDWLRTYTEGA